MLRQQLNECIAALPKQAPSSAVSNHLDPLLQKCEAKSPSESEPRRREITPLVTCCIYNQPEALNFLCAHDFPPSVVGRVLDDSHEGGNQMIHYLAQHGSIDMYETLIQIFRNEEGNNDIDPHSTILGQGNDHGDTPMMIASISNNIALMKHFVASTSNSATTLLQMQNESGDSALSLAYGHGHCDMVELIEPYVEVRREDWDQCQHTIVHARRLLFSPSFSSGDDETKVRKKIKNMESCLDILASKLEQQTKEKEEELFLLLEKDADPQKTSAPAQTKRRNKKKKKKSMDKKATSQTDTNETSPHHSTSTVAHDPSVPYFITQPDGTIRSSQIQNSISSSVEDQCKEKEHDTTVKNDNTSENSNDQLIQRFQIPESLCVQPSMLLLSPHGMAINLSPCQLDAVQCILERQLDCVHNARQIQSRLLEKKR